MLTLNTLCVLVDLLIDCSFDVRFYLFFSACAASPKQWEGIAVVLEPKLGDFIETDINYDLTNQKLRYMERFIYNNSKPVTELFEQIFDFNQVATSN